MTELNKIHISEIATLYAVQDKPEAYYYDTTEADKKILELELALWIARYKVTAGKISSYNRIMSDCRIGEQSKYDKYENKYNKWIRCCNKCAAKALEIRKKLEDK